mmetsp:Transcript_68435/g.135224  ORF Transcript_68435/g.135224 Transcript_68435/m.135224 type:complete len:185 (+) Transcript_68435:85-639(+)
MVPTAGKEKIQWCVEEAEVEEVREKQQLPSVMPAAVERSAMEDSKAVLGTDVFAAQVLPRLLGGNNLPFVCCNAIPRFAPRRTADAAWRSSYPNAEKTHADAKYTPGRLLKATAHALNATIPALTGILAVATDSFIDEGCMGESSSTSSDLPSLNANVAYFEIPHGAIAAATAISPYGIGRTPR